jgi:hypothetical protein
MTSPMRPGLLTPNEFETAILERLAKHEPAIQESIRRLHVYSRAFTGVGSFTTFDTEKETTGSDARTVCLSSMIKMPGVANGMGAVLFLKGTMPLCLEIFTYGNDYWDGVYDGFVIE